MRNAFYLILAGIAIGILIAPDKGSETRRKLKDGFEDMKDQVLDQINDIIAQGENLVKKETDMVAETADAIRNKTNEDRPKGYN